MGFGIAAARVSWPSLAMLAAGELEPGQGVGFSNFFSLDLPPATAISETDVTAVPGQPRLAALYPGRGRFQIDYERISSTSTGRLG